MYEKKFILVAAALLVLFASVHALSSECTTNCKLGEACTSTDNCAPGYSCGMGVCRPCLANSVNSTTMLARS